MARVGFSYALWEIAPRCYLLAALQTMLTRQNVMFCLEMYRLNLSDSKLLYSTGLELGEGGY